MKKNLLFTIVLLSLATTSSVQAGKGGTFGAAFGGSLFGSALGSSVANSRNRERVVYVEEGRISRREARRLNKKIEKLEDTIDQLEEENQILQDKIEESKKDLD